MCVFCVCTRVSVAVAVCTGVSSEWSSAHTCVWTVCELCAHLCMCLCAVVCRHIQRCSCTRKFMCAFIHEVAVAGTRVESHMHRCTHLHTSAHARTTTHNRGTAAYSTSHTNRYNDARGCSHTHGYTCAHKYSHRAVWLHTQVQLHSCPRVCTTAGHRYPLTPAHPHTCIPTYEYSHRCLHRCAHPSVCVYGRAQPNTQAHV